MPPGYGYLTRHLRTRQLTLCEAVQIADRRVLVLKMRKKHGSVPKIHTRSGLDSHNEQTPALKVPLQTELRFRPRGYEQPPPPPHWRARGAIRLQVARRRPLQQQRQRPPLRVAELRQQWPQGGQPLQQCPRPRLRSRGEDKYKEPEARSADGGGDPVGDEDFSSRRHLSTNDRSRLPTSRSPLGSFQTSGAPTSAQRRRTGAKAGQP
jgi:hypothetical protein